MTTTTRPTSSAVRFDRMGLLALAGGHFVVDMLVGAIPALMPLFVREFRLSDLAASMILGSSLAASSATQPFFGAVADRRPAPWLLWGGVLLGAIATAATAGADSYPVLLGLIIVAGLGVAGYHPEAARVANRLSGDRPATGLAWFMVGGNAGSAAGPLVAALTIPFMGRNAVLVFLIPAIISAAVIWWYRQPLQPEVGRTVHSGPRPPAHIPGVLLLLVVTTLRTWSMFVVMALMPLVLTQERHMSERTGALSVFGFAAAGAVGTVVGARISDRIGPRRMLAFTMPFAAPFIAGAVLLPTYLGILSMAAAGFVVLGSFSVTVALAQDYLPSRLALAAGLMIGFGAIGSAPPGLAIFGALADATSRTTALVTLAALPVIAGLLALLLPAPRPASPAPPADPDAVPAAGA